MYGRISHLGHVTETICIGYRSLILRTFHMTFESNSLVASEKMCLNIFK